MRRSYLDKGLLKNLLVSLIENNRIKTTESKAKALKSLADRVISRAKEKNLNQRYLLSLLPKKLVEKLVKEISPRFADRTSGFTRIIKLGRRAGDNAPMALLEFVEDKVVKP